MGEFILLFYGLLVKLLDYEMIWNCCFRFKLLKQFFDVCFKLFSKDFNNNKELIYVKKKILVFGNLWDSVYIV